MEPRVAQGLRRVAHRGPVDRSWLVLRRLLTIAAAERLVGALGALGARCFCCAVPAAVWAVTSL
eukprot:7140873-Prymnesium_polylepis.1